ncbi:hypothetical protein PR048_020953 [Dryococelus australis]|uniref:PiggyBac transposable element-derived protein domain-containing protein n=1 Tax=Dryococelus australis TaxID=614101 RepID=A0ABQ9GWV8_9NEOP|nr:hypothetical protein PR048_020953 [Dryococelus australis]
MSTMPNIYALQNCDMNFKPTSKDEIQKLFAIHIAMGSLRFLRARLYWDTARGVKFFNEYMTRNGFLPFVQIYTLPLYDCFCKQCLQLPVEKSVCVDEQMVPFKGTLSVKQYMQSKPSFCGERVEYAMIFLFIKVQLPRLIQQGNGRGCTDVVSADQKVVLVKWYDNKSVVIGSNFLGVGKKDEVKRWDKEDIKYIKVERLEVIQ